MESTPQIAKGYFNSSVAVGKGPKYSTSSEWFTKQFEPEIKNLYANIQELQSFLHAQRSDEIRTKVTEKICVAITVSSLLLIAIKVASSLRYTDRLPKLSFSSLAAALGMGIGGIWCLHNGTVTRFERGQKSLRDACSIRLGCSTIMLQSRWERTQINGEITITNQDGRHSTLPLKEFCQHYVTALCSTDAFIEISEHVDVLKRLEEAFRPPCGNAKSARDIGHK